MSNYANNTNFNNNGKDLAMNNYANNTNLDTMNPAPRCPVVLLLDTSGSMFGKPIDELNAGLKQFIQETADDEAAGMSVELEVITFDDTAETAMPFTPIADVERDPDPLVAGGCTAMGAAITMAMSEIKGRRNLYRANGISSYRPWVVLMTDGEPNDNWSVPAAELRKQAEAGKITLIGIEIGQNADHDTMCKIVPVQPGPVKLQGLRFKQFFRWLTDSLRSVSTSAVSDQDNVQFGPIRSWADLDNM